MSKLSVIIKNTYADVHHKKSTTILVNIVQKMVTADGDNIIVEFIQRTKTIGFGE